MPGSSTPKELLGTSTGPSGDQELGTEAEVDLGGWEGEDWAPRQCLILASNIYSLTW